MAAWQNGSPWNSMEPMLGKHWGIIHPCCHPEDGPAPVDEEHMCLGTAFPHGFMARVVTTPVEDMSINATEVWEHFSLFRSTLPNHQAFVYCCFFFSVGMEARTHDYRNAWNHTKTMKIHMKKWTRARPKRLVYMAIDGVAPRIFLRIFQQLHFVTSKTQAICGGILFLHPTCDSKAPRWTSSVRGVLGLHRWEVVLILWKWWKKWKISCEEREEMEREQEKLRQDWEALDCPMNMKYPPGN